MVYNPGPLRIGLPPTNTICRYQNNTVKGYVEKLIISLIDEKIISDETKIVNRKNFKSFETI